MMVRLSLLGALGTLAPLSLLVTACNGGGGGNAPSETSSCNGDVFVAFAKDFRGYHSWDGFDVTDGAELAGIHDGSTVIEYINHQPSGGLSEFPLCTIIVKEATGGTIPHELFAMVKRGGGFTSGLPGWEWFELANLDDGQDSVKIVWQGFGPPKGETYGGDVNSNCNTCHNACGNDGVCAQELNLANF